MDMSSRWGYLEVYPTPPHDTIFHLGPRSYCLFVPSTVTKGNVKRVLRELRSLLDEYPQTKGYVDDVENHVRKTYPHLI